jgi:hypothetical protein
MNNPDWTEAPKDATHWDTVAGVWCNNRGARRPDGTYDKCFIRDWGTHRYIARPENNTDREGALMTKVTVEHKGKPQPSIFEAGNLVVTGTNEIVLVTGKMSDDSPIFLGMQLAPHTADVRRCFDKKGCEQFHGTLTLESPQ